jgi:hypothetical protein
VEGDCHPCPTTDQTEPEDTNPPTDTTPTDTGDCCPETGTGTDTTDTGCCLDTPPDPLDVDDDGDGLTENQGDCDDGQPAINPMATDLVGDAIDQNCDGMDGFDGDGDGHASEVSGGDDCDDTDLFTFPGAIEIWYDDVDQGCLGDDWTGDFDQDGDRHNAEAVGGDDCLDTDATVNPEMSELIIPNGLDDDCNGLVDQIGATVAWDPTGDPVLDFVMNDADDGLTLLLMSANLTLEEHAVVDDATSCWVQIAPADTEFEDEFTTLTYLYSTSRWFTDLGTNRICWGPNVAELLALGYTCVETDPTTW